MIKYEAIGIVEAKHFTTALQILDTMCKASDVTFLASEKVLGGRLVTTIVGGSISNVKAAIEAAKFSVRDGEELIKGAMVISKPHEEIMKFIIKDSVENTKEIVVNEIQVSGAKEPVEAQVQEAKEEPKKRRRKSSTS